MKHVLTLCLVAALQLSAQKTKPDFENDQIIINEPHPGIEIAGYPKKLHDHKLNRVMVYMHPGGETLTYQDGRKVVLKWREGEAQWSPASGLHYSQIPPENPVFPGPMIVDIGIKKAGDPRKVASSALDPLKVDPKDYTLDFENNQVRVVRLKVGPHQSVPLHEHSLSCLQVYLTDQNVRETLADGKAEVKQHKAGEFSWSGPSKRKLENLSDKPFEAVFVELKD